jgi:TusA-related sulfurtransferase
MSFTLLKVSQAFRIIPPGDILEVFWSDPDTRADLLKILPESSYDLISMEEMKDGLPSYRMQIKKKVLEGTA